MGVEIISEDEFRCHLFDMKVASIFYRKQCH